MVWTSRGRGAREDPVGWTDVPSWPSLESVATFARSCRRSPRSKLDLRAWPSVAEDFFEALTSAAGAERTASVTRFRVSCSLQADLPLRLHVDRPRRGGGR